MIRFFGRKQPDRSETVPVLFPDHGRLSANVEPLAISYVASLKLEQVINDQLISKLFPPLPIENEGFRKFGCFWPGPVVVLDSENKVCSLQSGHGMTASFAKLRLDEPIQVAIQLYPGLTLAKEREHNGYKFRYFELIDKTQATELLVTERDGNLCRFQFSRLGFEAEDLLRMERHQEREKLRIAEWETRSDKLGLWKNENECNRMLHVWAENRSEERRTNANALKSFKDFDVNDTIKLLRCFNWDDGLAPLFWFISQKEAPIAAIFEIFSISEADHYLNPTRHKPAENRRDEYGLLSEIRINMESGFYGDKSSFDGKLAWDHAHLGAKDAEYMKPFKTVFCRQFP